MNQGVKIMTTQNTAMKGLLAGLILSFGLGAATSSSAFAKDHRSHLLSQRGAYERVTTHEALPHHVQTHRSQIERAASPPYAYEPANQFVHYDGYQRDRQMTIPNWLINGNDPELNLGRGSDPLTR
jgi:hypothetical protein